MSVAFRNLVVVFLLFALFPPSEAQVRKYEVKSGIVTYDVIKDVGRRKLTNRMIVSFDDYGMKECRETYEEGKLRESFLSDGTTLWTLIHKNREALNRGPASRGTELRCSWDEVSEKDKKQGRARQIAPMMICGKSCDAFTIVTANGPMTYAGWKNVLLFMGLEGKEMRMITKAVKVEEDVEIPPTKFTVPSNYAKK